MQTGRKEVIHIFSANEQGESPAADLMPLVYDELRRLAAGPKGAWNEGVMLTLSKMSSEP